MSYLKTLDEMSTESITGEIRRRYEAGQKGLCDYCGRGLGSMPLCRFPDRHHNPLQFVPNPASLTFRELAIANEERVRAWHGAGWYTDGWSGGDWANAMQGEAGEAGNVVKKLRRAELGLAGNRDAEPAELVTKLGEELADTVIYADLLASYYHLVLSDEVELKFNAVSDRVGFPQKIGRG